MQKNQQMFDMLTPHGSFTYSKEARSRRGQQHQMSQLYDRYFKGGGLNKSSTTELTKTKTRNQDSDRYDRLTRGESSYASQTKHHSTSRFTDAGGKDGQHTRRSLDYHGTAESTTLSTNKHSRTYGGSQLPAGTSRSGVKSRFTAADSSVALSQANEDRMAVRDIVNACTESIQPPSKTSYIEDLTRDEEGAAVAYTKLQALYAEFMEQFTKKRQAEDVSEKTSAAMRQFFEAHYEKAREAKETKGTAKQGPGTRSIW